ncbi:hypothetical protein V1512DRAFT_260147 [Lipomyces arxii]|uniref:uncharacterized protein n=1 Tax=Lipomyces arxii TaxID=56418 RepID=UPI0034CD4414
MVDSTTLVALLLIFVITLAMSLSVLGLLPQTPRFYVRLFLCFLSMCACATYGVFASIILAILQRRGLSQWCTGRAFAWLTSLIIGVKIDFKNEEKLTNTRPAIIVGNHQTEMDVFLLGRIFPRYCSVTAKSSLKYVPFLGWFMIFSGTVFIDRQNRGQAIRALDGAITRMKRERLSVFIFPEGTRSYFTEPEMLSFKRGAFHLAIQSGFPIVPVVISNYSNIFNFKTKTLNSGTITVQALDPIETTGMSADDVDTLMATTRSRMLEALQKISSVSDSATITPFSSAVDPDAESTGLLDATEADAADSTADLEPRLTTDTAASELAATPTPDSSDQSKTIELDNRA